MTGNPNALLRTVHGSHLYGLAHAGSDLDTYTVIATGHRARQTISGDQDTLVIPIGAFLLQAGSGVPQALEAMFSPIAEPGPLDALRHGFRPDTAASAHRYRRTITSFAAGTLKQRRHALRLATNLTDLLTYGWFSPRLSPALADELTAAAALPDEDYFADLAARCPVPLDALPTGA
ncbi:nucleotidyltransferase domain-containing protein [Cellulosimicrobium sp. Marseille-Q4280]|uniref:nucleotidyltransferase domain-containing protein n=1 Tax=Cellulosimicrobium sp. Marseille-Q4280 TaxID=2937992 RepID=UPI00203B1EDE|nr:nucleotidyltransferase domain-containing protein [Cellulosimicrobium sp. Marseille-Q4280]